MIGACIALFELAADDALDYKAQPEHDTQTAAKTGPFSQTDIQLSNLLEASSSDQFPIYLSRVSYDRLN